MCRPTSNHSSVVLGLNGSEGRRLNNIQYPNRNRIPDSNVPTAVREPVQEREQRRPRLRQHRGSTTGDHHVNRWNPRDLLVQLNEHQRFFVFLKILLRVLHDHKEVVTLCKARLIIDNCIVQHKAGNDNYMFFRESVIVRLRTAVPELYWNLTSNYLGYACD